MTAKYSGNAICGIGNSQANAVGDAPKEALLLAVRVRDRRPLYNALMQRFSHFILQILAPGTLPHSDSSALLLSYYDRSSIIRGAFTY